MSKLSECLDVSELLGQLGGLLSKLGQGSVNDVLCGVLLSSVSRLEFLFSGVSDFTFLVFAFSPGEDNKFALVVLEALDV